MWRKLISGGDGRRSRFHTEQNERIGLFQLVKDFPEALFWKMSTKLGAKRPERPWWPTTVIPVVSNLLSKNSTVLEFGSGSSTIWLARRAKFVISMEDNEEWAGVTQKRLSDLGMTNARVIFAQNEHYFQIPEVVDKVDLVIVDGSYRWKCVEHAYDRLSAGGAIYLDNADADKDLGCYQDQNSNRLAQALLEQLHSINLGSTLQKFRSLADGELHATEGWVLALDALPVPLKQDTVLVDKKRR